MTDKKNPDDISSSINDIFDRATAKQRFDNRVENTLSAVFILCVSAMMVAGTFMLIRWML